jgi:nicotinamidase-related amidase
MTITTLDAKSALLVVDLQKGIVGMAVAHPIADVVNNAAGLADAFRKHGLPVVLINVDGLAPGRTEQARRVTEFPAGWTDLVPELNRQPGDHVVTKRTWGAATTAGVESTARHAHELGFNVVLAVDAMTDMNADAHHNSITRIFPRMGETGTTQEIIDLLNANARGEQGNT